MGPSLARMLILRSPLAVAEGLLAFRAFSLLYESVSSMEGPIWETIFRQIPDLDPETLRLNMQGLPQLPAVSHVLPWMLLGAPIYVLSLWLHDAVWDHGCLWMVGGLQLKRGFRTSLLADSEALQVSVIGAALGLLNYLPRIGWLLAFPVGAVSMYFWILRGFALAAFHDCPAWKGVLATILHVIVAACCAAGFALFFFILVTQVAG